MNVNMDREVIKLRNMRLIFCIVLNLNNFSFSQTFDCFWKGGTASKTHRVQLIIPNGDFNNLTTDPIRPTRGLAVIIKKSRG